MKLVCKHNHNGFIKGKVYDGINVPNAMMIIRRDEKKWFYSLKPLRNCDFIETWFWTLEEWRETKLKEIGL